MRVLVAWTCLSLLTPASATAVSTQTAAASAAARDCSTPPDECARAQIERGEFASAVRILEPWVREHPRQVRGLNLLGLALTGADRIDEANARFREALAIDARFHAARRNLAINTFNQGRRAESAQLFAQVLQDAPADPIAHVHLAEIAFERRDTRTALAHYEQARARLSSSPAWQLHYAMCLLENGDKAGALAAFEALPSDAGAALFDAGVALGRVGAHADAARFFDRAGRTYKDPYAAGYNRTLMLVEAGDAQAAIDAGRALLAAGSKTAELYNLLSRAYVQAGRIVEAYDALREAIRIEPTAETHYVDLAMICLDHENYDLGLEILDIGLRTLPGSSTLYVERGVLLVMKGLFDQAQQAFDAAQARAPDSAIPSIALAMAWMQTGHNPRAVELLRRWTRRQTKDPVVFHTLGLALMRSGAEPSGAAGDEAVEAFSTAVRLNPQYGAARAELGKLLLKRGDVPGAVTQLEQAVALDPNAVGPSYALAQAYRRTGETARAQALLARVSKLNAEERGDDPDRELKRAVQRIVREGAARPAATR